MVENVRAGRGFPLSEVIMECLSEETFELRPEEIALSIWRLGRECPGRRIKRAIEKGGGGAIEKQEWGWCCYVLEGGDTKKYPLNWKGTFKTEERSGQLHKVQLWSFLWVTYRQDQADRDPEALHASKRGKGGFKGAKAKRQNQLRRERSVCTNRNQGFFPLPGGLDH